VNTCLIVTSIRHRVLVTRSSHQASELADRLAAAGFEPIVIPTIEILPPTNDAPLNAALKNLDSFHWLIFTSVNAVDAFTKRFAAEKKPSNLKIAAIGPATSRALTAAGYLPDLLPPQAVAESLAESLLAHIRQPDNTPTRFLLIRAERARDHLPDTLRAAGANVTIVHGYRSETPQTSIEKLRVLFKTPRLVPRLITFTSSSTATNLLEILKSTGIELPPDILRASIGPITSKALTDWGYPPQIEALEATIPALVDAILVRSPGLIL